MQETIERWITLSPEPLDASDVQAEARVRPTPDGFELALEIEVAGNTSQETLAAARCESLVQVVALKVALAAVPAEALPEEPARPHGAPSSPRDVPAPSPAEPPRGDDELVFGVRLPFGVTVGVLPSPAPSFGLAGLANVSALQIEVGAQYLLQQHTPYDDVPSVGANLDVFAGVARVCPGAPLGALQMRICAGAVAGVIRAGGFGTARVWTVHEAWAAALLGPTLTLPLGAGLRAAVGLDALLALTRPAFALRSLPTLHEPESSALQMWLGLEYWPG